MRTEKKWSLLVGCLPLADCSLARYHLDYLVYLYATTTRTNK